MITISSKLRDVAQRLGIDPVWLWVVIQHESGWNPKALNPVTGAAGLIQFMPSTALSLGTSTVSLLKMTIDQQLEYVYKYLSPYKGRMMDLDDVYFAVFYPAAIGKPDSYVLGSEKGAAWAAKIAAQNPANNPNRDAQITVSEVRQVITDKAKKYGYQAPITSIPKPVRKGFKKTPEYSFANLKKLLR